MRRLTKLHWLLITIIVALIFSSIAFYIYRSETEQIRNEKFAYLNAISNLKIDQLTKWRAERISEAEFFPSVDGVIKSTINLSYNIKDITSSVYLNETLEPIQQRHKYHNIFITDINYRVLFTLKDEFTAIDTLTLKVIDESIAKDSILFSEIYYCNTHSAIHLDIVSPIKNNNGKTIGAMVFRFDPRDYLYPLIQKWPTPSKSGESLLLRDNDSVITILSDVRFKKHAALSLTLPKSDTNYISAKAFSSSRVVLDGIDYRRVKVLASAQKIEGSDWLLVSKIDQDEIFEDLRYRTVAITLITIIAFLFLGTGILFLYKNRQSQVYKDLFYKEKELNEHQVKTKAITDAAQDAIIMMDEKGNISFWNPSAVRILGYTAEEVLNKNLHTILAPESYHLLHNNAFEQFKSSGKGNAIGSVMEFSAIRKDGVEVPIELSLSAINNNGVWNSVGIIRDITERKNAETKLKHSEEKFRKAFQTSPDSININRLSDGLYVSVNDGYINMTGYSELEVVGKTSLEINIWQNPEDRVRLVNGLKENGIVENLEAQFRMKDGRILDGLMSASVIKLNNEPHIISITIDITERKKFEAILKQSEQNYHHIINGMQDAVYVIGFNGKIIDVNKAAVDTLGYTKEEFLKLTPNDIDDSLSNEQIKQLIERIPVEEKQSFQTTHITKNKKRIPVEINSTMIIYRGIKSILSIARDITPWLKAQEDIYKSESLLKETQKLAKVGGWEYDVEKNQIYWTDECFRIHGVNSLSIKSDPEECISKSIQCYDEKDKPIVMLAFNRCVNEGIPYDSEFPFTTFQNEKIWIRTLGLPVYQEDKIVKVIGNIIDITDRKTAEEALRKSEERWLFAIEGSDDGVWDWNIITGEVFFSTKWKTMLGYDDEDIKNDLNEWEKLVHQDDLNYVNSEINKHLKNETEYYCSEHRLLCKNGSYKWILDRGKVLVRNADGSAKRMVGTHKDITDSKNAEQVLKESESKFHSLFENSPNAIFISDPKTLKIIDCNENACSMNGYNRDELIGQSINILHPPYVSEILINPETHKLQIDLLKQKRSITIESSHIRKDGTIFPIESSISLIMLNGKEVTMGIDRDITIRKNTEQALKFAKDRLQLMIEGTPHLFFYEQSVDGTLQYLSPSVVQISGRSINDWIERKDWFITDSPINELALNRIKEDLSGVINNDPILIEITHANGSLIYLEVYERPVFKDNKVIGLQGVAHNVTDTRRAVQSLFESEEKYRELFESLHEGFSLHEIILDENGRPIDYKFLEVNKSFENMTGLKSKDIIGKTVKELIPTIEDYWIETYGNVALTGEPKKIENFVKELNKYYRVHSYSPAKNRFACITEDITDVKKNEIKIKQLSLAVEQNPATVVITDTNGIIEYVNPKFTELTQYTFEDVIGKNPSVLKSGHTTIDEYKSMWKTIKSGSEWNGNFLNKKKDGQLFWESAKISPLRNSEGKITHFVAIKEDITQRVETEKELTLYRENLESIVKSRTKEIESINNALLSEIEKEKQTEILLQQSLEKEKELSELKSRFISTASHEFRTPLTTILSSAELIQRYGKKWEEEKYLDHLQRITNSVDYLTNLMDDVLTISRIESGKIVFTPVETDLKEICNKVISDFKLSDDDKHKLEFNYKSDQTIFNIDQKQVQMILQNLLSNAFKYSNTGDKIELTIQTDENILQLKIADNGMGIADNDLPHLFEPFYRSLNTESIQGTGLGLSIVKNAVELHGGTITVNSQLGKGTTFLVSIPLRQK